MKKEPLFDLITSLTMSEKRFFKIFSQRHVIGGVNQYLELFDFIDKENKLDNSILLKQSFVKNLSAEKNYLYRLILKSLNSFHAQNSERRKVYDYLISIDVLFQKGLYNQALELVAKAKKLARANELLRQELLLTELQEELLLKDQKYSDVIQVIDEDKTLLNQIDNLLSMQELTTKGYHENLSKGVIREEQDLHPFNELINDELVKNDDNALTQRARLHQISVQLTYNMVAGKNDEVLKYVKQILKHYEGHPFLINYTPIGYVSANFILGNAGLSANQQKITLNTIEKFDAIAKIDSVKKSQKAMSSLFFYKHILHLQIDNNINLEEIEHEIPKHIPFIGKAQLYDLYFQMSLSFFTQNNFKKALKWSNHIINDIKFKSRDDFMNTVKLFNLLIHFELGNDFTLEYISNSTLNYLKRKNRLFQVEKLLIKFFNKYEIHSTSGDLNKELEKLSVKLLECKTDTYESKAFQYFDYENWVKSKLKK